MTTATLIRVPSKRYPNPYGYRVGKYDYTTLDGRWYVQQHGGCGGGWEVTDLTGEYVCESCFRPATVSDQHATIVRTLAAAKAFIAEWGV
jgi:hypothetical protein